MLSLVITLFLVILPCLWLLFHGKHQPKLPPGPHPLPIIGNLHMLGQLPHRSLAKLAQKHGPIMHLRLGQVPTIVVSSAEAAKLFLKQHDVVFASRPNIQAAKYMSFENKAMAFAPYGDYWRRVRKLCSMQLLSAAKVEEFEPLRRAEIESVVMKLRVAAESGEVVELDEKVGELMEDIIFKMVVGKDKMEGNRFGLHEIVAEALELAGAFNIADFVPFLAPFDIQGLTRKMKEVSKAADKILENIIEDRLKQGNERQHKDILSTVIALMGNSSDDFFSSFNRENVKAIMLDLFVGGIDTSAVTIVWALSVLLKHPRIMKILQKELDATVGRDRMVRETDLPKLAYLDMVVKETFRLYPVAPLLVPRESLEDVIINGYMIPRKSRIIFNYWAIGRDVATWTENAEGFYPERFISKEIDVQGRHFELIPFGSGRRGCPGINLGLITVKIILAQLIHCFNWDLPKGMVPEEVDMTEKFGLSMPRANKLLAIPKYRLR